MLTVQPPEELIPLYFMAGQYSGQVGDTAKLLLTYMGYIQGQAPVLHGIVQEDQVTKGYVDEAQRADLQSRMLASIGMDKFEPYHGIVEKLDGEEILVAYFFNSPKGPTAEACLDNLIKEAGLDRQAPRFYRNENGQIMKTYVLVDGVILAAPSTLPSDAVIEKDTLGLAERYQRLQVQNAMYNSTQASPHNVDTRIIGLTA